MGNFLFCNKVRQAQDVAVFVSLFAASGGLQTLEIKPKRYKSVQNRGSYFCTISASFGKKCIKHDSPGDTQNLSFPAAKKEPTKAFFILECILDSFWEALCSALGCLFYRFIREGKRSGTNSFHFGAILKLLLNHVWCFCWRCCFEQTLFYLHGSSFLEKCYVFLGFYIFFAGIPEIAVLLAWELYLRAFV